MKIGIVGKLMNNSFGIGKAYIEFASNIALSISGDSNPIISIIYPFSRTVDNTIDLLIIPGGADVIDFNNNPSVFNTNGDIAFEFFDKVVLPKYVTKGKAIFGICRGFQSLNIAFGGTLYNEIFTHKYSEQEKRWERVHEITPTEYFKNNIDGIGNKKKIEVNSLHHQGIKTLGAGLITIAEVKDNKNYHKSLIESFIHTELPIAGVQWHPEEYNCQFAITLIEEILHRKNNIEETTLKRIIEEHGIEY